MPRPRPPCRPGAHTHTHTLYHCVCAGGCVSLALELARFAFRGTLDGPTSSGDTPFRDLDLELVAPALAFATDLLATSLRCRSSGSLPPSVAPPGVGVGDRQAQCRLLCMSVVGVSGLSAHRVINKMFRIGHGRWAERARRPNLAWDSSQPAKLFGERFRVGFLRAMLSADRGAINWRGVPACHM